MKLGGLCLGLMLLIVLAKAENIGFDYKKHGADWSENEDQDWQQCGSETQQSPINLDYSVTRANSSYLFSKFSLMPGKVSWFNTTVYIKATSFFGQLYSKAVNDQMFALNATEIRIRCHSEHKINDTYYDLELQIFFVSMYPSSKNTKVGLSLFFQKGQAPNLVLQTIMDSFTQPGDTTSIKLDLSPLLNNLNEYNFWSYQGSSTIPPCNAGKLYWIITDKVNSMSQSQYNFFHSMFYNEQIEDGNWRAIQPVGTNPVSFYHV